MSTINGRSHKAVRYFREQSAALAVYWVYCARRNHEGIAWCSIPGLIKDTGWSQNPVREGRAWLIEHGALERVYNYVRPEWRKLPEDARLRKRARDRAEYYRVTGILVVEGITYRMLYAPVDDADADNPEDGRSVSQNDTAPDDRAGSESPGDVSQNDTLGSESPGDVSPGDSELITNPELDTTGDFELDTTTTSGADAVAGEDAPVVVVDETDQRVWDAAFHQLEMQLDRASFETWLRGAVLRQVEREAGAPGVPNGTLGVTTFVVGVRNSYALNMLQHRLYRSARRVLSDVAGVPLELRFEINEPSAQADDNEAMPLFRLLAQDGAAQPDGTPTIRACFEQYIGAVTEQTRAALEFLEAHYDAATVGYAFTVMAAAQAQGRVRDPLGYTLGILRKLEVRA